MKKLDREVKRIINRMIIATGIGALIMIAIYGYSKLKSNIDKVLTLNTHSDEYQFEYEISKQWREGAHGYEYGEQIDILVGNFTNKELADWKMELDFEKGCYLDSYWNGEFELNEDTGILTVRSVDFNDTIEVDEQQPFGMIVYSRMKNPITDGRFIYHDNVKLTEMVAFWFTLLVYIIFISSSCGEFFYTIKHINDRKKQDEYYRIINQSFLTFANTIDAKDSYTKGHSQRVAIYSRELARRLKKDEDFCQNIFYVGLLHDIGKIGVQDAILKKSAKLTVDEFNEIREHVSMGGDILKKFTAVKGIEEGARYHHEKYDGSGYMEGLKGEEIPIVARIIAVADAFDAMASARCYRSALEIDNILYELNTYSGSQFDPKIVPHMIDMIKEGAAPIILKENQLESEFGMDDL